MDRHLPLALIALGVVLASSLTTAAAAQERTDAQVEAQLRADWNTFFDLSETYPVHEAAVRRFITSSREWIAAQHPPIVGEEKIKAGRMVAEIVGTVRTTAGPWIELEFARSLLDPWHELLAADRASEGRLGAEFFGPNLCGHARFATRIDGPSAGLTLLDDNVLDRYVAQDVGTMRDCLELRAEIHRVLGEFEQAFSDVARWRALKGGSPVAEARRYSLHRVEMRLEIDIGRLDRAKAHWLAMKTIAAGSPDVTSELSAKMRDIEYHAAAGLHPVVARLSKEVIEGFPEVERRTLEGDVLFGEFLLRRAVALSRSGVDEAALAEADAIFSQLIAPGAPLSHGLRMVAVVESASLALRLGETERAEDALRMVDREFGAKVTSRLYRNRLAARRLEVALELGDDALLERAREELTATVDGLLESWGELALVPGGVGFLHFEERRHALSLLVQSILDEGGAESRARALDLVLRADAHSTLARRIDAPLATSEQLVELCERTNAALVVLLATQAVTHRFLVTGDGVEHGPCAGEETLRGRIEAAGRALARVPKGRPVDATFRDDDGDFAFLAGELLPTELRANPSRFSVVHVLAPDICGRAPFEVFPTSSGGRLGLTVPVARISSAAAVLALSRRDSARALREGHPVEMFALSGVEHGGVGIDLSLAELDQLKREAGVSINVQPGTSATRESFLRSMTRGAELFIVWSHGLNDLREPIPAGLLVARPQGRKDVPQAVVPGGPDVPQGLALLGASEIAGALAAAPAEDAPRVVLLAACSTGRAHVRIGDGSAGHLGGVFLSAGSSAVLLAERRIEREAALTFVRAYAAAFLKRGATAAEATLVARRAVAETKGFESPHYWAALQLVGWGGARAQR